MSYPIFIPKKLDLTFRAPNHCPEFHQNRIKIAAVGVFTDRLTEWQNDISDFIICPMLCYSNGTDHKSFYSFFAYYYSIAHMRGPFTATVVAWPWLWASSEESLLDSRTTQTVAATRLRTLQLLSQEVNTRSRSSNYSSSICLSSSSI